MVCFNKTITLLVVLLWVTTVSARGVYQTPRDFLKETFAGSLPQARLIWLTDEIKQNSQRILGHPLAGMRLRYWALGTKSAWILEEIGKEEPITTGIVINAGKIERVKILVFRESRGWEVRHAFFTDQFRQVTLKKDFVLSRSIDSISGATLSVNAVTKLARLALYFDRVARQANKKQ